MDQILSSEGNEYLTNRQNAKISYLQIENQQLQEDLQDLQNALRLNKEALRLAYETIERQKQGSQPSERRGPATGNKSSEGGNTTLPLHDAANNADQGNNELVWKLMNENKMLLEQNERLSKERNQALSKALIQEQICEEEQNFQKEIMVELEEKILELRRIIHDKEYAIQELENKKPIEERPGLVVKQREIITPTDQSMKMHAENENLRVLIYQATSKNNTLARQNNFLRDLQQVLMREIIKLRVAIKNPVNFMRLKDFVFEDICRTVDEDLDLHNYFYREYYLYEEREKIAQQQQQQAVIAAQQHSLFYNSAAQGQHAQGAPIVNLTPEDIRQLNLMTKNQLKDKVMAVLRDMQNYHLLLQRETENNRIFVHENMELQRFIEQLQETNSTLITANENLQKKQAQMKRELDLYKSYYYKYMEFMKNRRKNNLSTAGGLFSPLKPLQQNARASGAPAAGAPPGVTPRRPDQVHLELKASLQRTREAKQMQRAKNAPFAHKNDENNAEEHKQGEDSDNKNVQVSFLEDVDDVTSEGGAAGGGAASGTGAAAAARGKMARQGTATTACGVKTAAGSNNFGDQVLPDEFGNFEGNPKSRDFVGDGLENDDAIDECCRFDLDACKIYLLNLAKDLYTNYKFDNKGITKDILKRVEIRGQKAGVVQMFRARRSLSNPLDYMGEEQSDRAQKLGQKKKTINNNGAKVGDGARRAANDVVPSTQRPSVNAKEPGAKGVGTAGNGTTNTTNGVGGGGGGLVGGAPTITDALETISPDLGDNNEDVSAKKKPGQHSPFFDPNMSGIGVGRNAAGRLPKTRKITIEQFDQSFISQEDIEFNQDFLDE